MKLRVTLFGHRDWARRIYENIVLDADLKDKVDFLEMNTIAATARYADLGVGDFSNLKLPVRMVDPEDKKEIKDYLDDVKPDINLMFGWSWIIPKDVVESYKCICLHPSYLPAYRGGAPLQNQIIAGEKMGGVSLFVMANGIDDGDIVGQKHISLEGSLIDVFDRMVLTGSELTKSMLLDAYNGVLNPLPQDHSKATFCKRRKYSDSQITSKELSAQPAEYFYNKIRALQDPYPNAYLEFDGAKVLIKKAHLATAADPVINSTTLSSGKLPKCLEDGLDFSLVSNGAVRVTEYELKRY